MKNFGINSVYFYSRAVKIPLYSKQKTRYSNEYLVFWRRKRDLLSPAVRSRTGYIVLSLVEAVTFLLGDFTKQPTGLSFTPVPFKSFSK